MSSLVNEDVGRGDIAVTYEEIGKFYTKQMVVALDEELDPDNPPSVEDERRVRADFVGESIKLGADAGEAQTCFDTILGIWKKDKGF